MNVSNRIVVTSIFMFLVMIFINKSVEGQTMSPSSGVPVTVSYVDLKRYIGLWYEIARLPNSFQRDCARNTTASYELQPDGRIRVINRCVGADGVVKEAKGVARVVDTTSNSKLEVSFVRILGIQLFWGDYWIIGLDSNYKYAVVGNPSRKYGWILSRTPELSKEDMETAKGILRKNGYDPEKFVLSEQRH